jgi:hypothetical protein
MSRVQLQKPRRRRSGAHRWSDRATARRELQQRRRFTSTAGTRADSVNPMRATYTRRHPDSRCRSASSGSIGRRSPKPPLPDLPALRHRSASLVRVSTITGRGRELDRAASADVRAGGRPQGRGCWGRPARSVSLGTRSCGGGETVSQPVRACGGHRHDRVAAAERPREAGSLSAARTAPYVATRLLEPVGRRADVTMVSVGVAATDRAVARGVLSAWAVPATPTTTVVATAAMMRRRRRLRFAVLLSLAYVGTRTVPAATIMTTSGLLRMSSDHSTCRNVRVSNRAAPSTTSSHRRRRGRTPLIGEGAPTRTGPGCRVPGAYLRHGPTGGDHEAVRSRLQRVIQMSRPHRLVGHADARAALWPCPTSRSVVGAPTTPPAQPLRRPSRQLGAPRDHHQPAPLARPDPGLHGPTTTEGRTDKMVIRCLKRHVAREVFRTIITDLGLQRDHGRPPRIAA